MRLHREGTLTILLILVVSCLTIYAAWHWLPSVVVWPIASAMVALLGVVIWFFRVPPPLPRRRGCLGAVTLRRQGRGGGRGNGE
ncbi:MAG: hypothetical protein IPI95_05820 [Flavobacteriales bacterium]|nr:hypothetical protein [Flavobacteriales bacterium]